MKLLMPITSAPIRRNRHISISHRRDKPFIMAVIARYKRAGYGIIRHSLSDPTCMCCVVRVPYRLLSNSPSGWVDA